MTCPAPAPAPPDDAACPLCGQANQCAVVQGKPAAGCWCMHARVAPAALAAVPPPLRGQRCICPVCARSPEHSSERGSDRAGTAL
ncbi:hypothetical protein B2J86_16780 [Acidovorax sp. SRB_14]|uniref:cysteine-rich CWC family protein n=1 Tax=Acidovorax sp. SRB_14 TaxID=1962699 RepID=UPI0015665A36|nr:cysteine-rich CWC family protein [Acidovorax sp. SRB_14]NMM82562.1 hypothetical protein [Acidovorax sp. SRB_14]